MGEALANAPNCCSSTRFHTASVDIRPTVIPIADVRGDDCFSEASSAVVGHEPTVRNFPRPPTLSRLGQAELLRLQSRVPEDELFDKLVAVPLGGRA